MRINLVLCAIKTLESAVKRDKSFTEVSIFIHNILKAIQNIEQYIASLSLIQFRESELIIDAVIRNFEIIGEVSQSIPRVVQKAYPEVPWKKMLEIRNILIHENFGMDVDIIWYTMKKELPKLKRQLTAMVSKERST